MKRRFLKDDLLRHGGLMFLANGLVNLFNLSYQLFMVRSLSPSYYAVLNSLMAMFLILSQPGGVVQTVVTKFVSNFESGGEGEKVKFFLYRVGKWALFGAIFLFVLVFLGRGVISSFLKIPSSAPVVAVGIIMFLYILFPVIMGALQGMQRFWYLAVSMIASAGIKLALGIALIMLGFGVLGALNSIVISLVVGILLATFLLFKALKQGSGYYGTRRDGNLKLVENPGRSIDFSEVHKYFLPVAIVNLCLMVLTSIDLILVKHFFSPTDAGYYSVAQMAGKIILFFPGAISIVMFPKVAHFHAQARDTLPILRKSIMMAVLVCAGPILVGLFFPALLLNLLAGKVYLQSIPLVRMFVISMGFFALIQILWTYQLAVHNSSFLYPVVAFTVLQVVLISIFHQSLAQVLYVMCATSFVMLVQNLQVTRNRRSQTIEVAEAG